MNSQILASVETLETLEVASTSKKARVVRELPISEWDKLREAFLVMGDNLPDAKNSTIFVAVELEEDKEDRVLGFVVMQSAMQIHVEPLFIYPEAQGKGIHTLLYDVVDLTLKLGKEVMNLDKLPYFITLKDERLIERALERDFKELDVKLFVKEL